MPDKDIPLDDFLQNLKLGDNKKDTKKVSKIGKIIFEISGKKMGELKNVQAGILFMKSETPISDVPFLEELGSISALGTGMFGNMVDVLEIAIQAKKDFNSMIDSLCDNIADRYKSGDFSEDEIARIKQALD